MKSAVKGILGLALAAAAGACVKTAPPQTAPHAWPQRTTPSLEAFHAAAVSFLNQRGLNNVHVIGDDDGSDPHFMPGNTHTMTMRAYHDDHYGHYTGRMSQHVIECSQTVPAAGKTKTPEITCREVSGPRNK